MLTRDEHRMLNGLLKTSVPTLWLTAYATEAALSTFRRLHDAHMVEPMTPECWAYTISDTGRQALLAHHPPSIFDMAVRLPED